MIQIKLGVNKDLKNKLIWHWGVIPVVGGAMIAYFFCRDCFAEGRYVDFLENAVISITFWMVLGNGNGLMAEIAARYVSWLEAPFKRFLLETFLMLSYTIAASTLIIYIYVEWYFKANFVAYVQQNGWFSVLVVPLSITVFMAFFLQGRSFLMSWRQAAIDVEKLKTENAVAKLEALKSQVNPHFLFNSLNALTSLVHSNPDNAVEFIQKLSEVYRYVLDHQYDELVDLDSELELAHSYVFLNKIRHGDNLQVTFHENGLNGADYQIPPLTLQILLENCFKHNEISRENHLEVSVDIKEDRLLVSNNINPVLSPKENSKGIGLKNIQSRYEHLSSGRLVIDQTEETYSISVPLLKIDAL